MGVGFRPPGPPGMIRPRMMGPGGGAPPMFRPPIGGAIGRPPINLSQPIPQTPIQNNNN